MESIGQRDANEDSGSGTATVQWGLTPESPNTRPVI